MYVLAECACTMHHVSERARERERHRARNKYAWHQVGVYCVRIRKRKQLERARDSSDAKSA